MLKDFFIKEGDADNSELFFVADGEIELFVDVERETGKPLILKVCRVIVNIYIY
jgi:hypothetical protein